MSESYEEADRLLEAIGLPTRDDISPFVKMDSIAGQISGEVGQLSQIGQSDEERRHIACAGIRIAADTLWLRNSDAWRRIHWALEAEDLPKAADRYVWAVRKRLQRAKAP
jgi:hypothetical protein